MKVLHDLELRHLSALRAVAAERSFGKAAVMLGYTQSAVSQQIAALEKMVGGAVFERPGGPKPVSLTPLGALLLGHAEQLLDRITTVEDDLSAFVAGRVGTISIGTFQSVSVRILPNVLHRFRSERPNVEVRLFDTDEQDELLKRLDDGRLDISFLVEPFDDSELDVVRLCDDPFVVLSPPDMDVGDVGAGAFNMDLLSGVPLVSQNDSACQRLIEGGLRRAGVDLNVVFRSNDNAAVQAMVRAGVGHAVMPALAVDADDPDVVIRRLDPGIPARTISLAVPRTKTLAPSVEAFVTMARELCHGMTERSELLEASAGG